MQRHPATLPKLNLLRHHAKPAPKIRQRNVAIGKLLFELGKLCLERLARIDAAALL